MHDIYLTFASEVNLLSQRVLYLIAITRLNSSQH
jgi:hypothetical protein